MTNFTTSERQILYFSLHYISIKVESHSYVAALEVNGLIFLYIYIFFKISVITLIQLHKVIFPAFFF